jgi:uncharacterized protein involved in outer membrane biogenesis
MSDTAASSSSEPSWRRWLRRVAIMLGVFVALVVLAWLIVPLVARSQLESRLTEGLGRTTTVESVEFNPLLLRLTVRKLAIADTAGSAPVLAFDELVADGSSESIVRWAPVFDAVKLVRPALSLARGSDGRYNIQDLIDRALNAPDGPTPGFSFNNIEIDGGAIAFDDGVAGRKHRLEKLDVGVPFLSSLPYQTEIHVTPRFNGSFNGSHFALGGDAVPFAERREAVFDIDFDALPLKEYVAYLPVRPRVDLAGGALTTRLKVVFIDGKPDERKLEIRGDVRVDGLAIKRRDGSSLAAAERIALTLDRIDVFGRDVRIASVAADAPVADVRRLKDGTLELATPLFEAASAPPARVTAANPAAAPDKPWSVTVQKATIARGAVVLADETSGFRTELADATVDASNLSTKAGEKAHVKLAFVSADRIASFKGEADVEPTVPAATGTLDFEKFSLSLLLPYYRSALAVDVQKGSLDFAGRFALGADGNVTVSDGVASIADLRLALPGQRQPFWRFPSLAVSGVAADLRGRKVTIGEFQSVNAELRLARERDGSLEAARLMKTTATTGVASDRDTWTLALKKLRIERAAIDVEDRVPQPVVKLAVRDLALDVTDLSNARGARSTVSLRARVGERGRVSFAGPITSNPVSATGQLDASGLGLVAVKAYVESNVNVVLTGGTLAAKGRLAIDVPDSAPVTATWKGDVTVTDFAALDKPTSSDLARWKSLTLAGADITSAPLRVAIERIGIDDYFARVIIYQDGTLNVTRLLTPGAEPEPAPGAKSAAPPPVGAPTREALPITIGRIELARGNVNFSDFFVRPNYAANLTDVTGSVSAMSADLAGDVAIAARVDNTAPVEVAGRVNPFAKELSLDLAAKAHDIDLPPLTPYSVKYAGYGIDKGKLTFDVHYKVENRKLSAENRLVLDQLTFNRQHVDSPTATKLPVLLAVSLLKDSHGVIDIQLPVSGSLDDPEFSVGGLIVRVIVNLIAKAVTAPFALLSAAFGGGEELSTVPFAPGSAALGEGAGKQIDTLGKALADRPGLKLEIGGRADPSSDREALRRAAVENAMKHEKMKSLAAAGNAPASVDLVTIGADERVRWLTEAYRESSIKDRPRNVFGMLKDIPPADMEATLFADAKVDDDALRLLANARAQSVKDALAAKGVAGERLFLIAPHLGSEGVAPMAAATSPGSGAPEPATAASPRRVDLALR